MADEQEFVFELGDTVALNTARYGVVIGKIYYRDGDLIRILPQGVSDRLYDFPLIDGEFSPELGFKDARWISKNPLPTFVEQQDLQAGQFFETFTANGEPGGIFKIVSVNVDDDIITAQDESGAETEIEFGYIGVPLDLPFAVIRVREPPATEATFNDDNSVGINVDKPKDTEDEFTQQAINEANDGISTSADAIRQELEESTAAAAKAQEALMQGEPLDDDEFEIKEIGEIIVPVFEQQQIIPTTQRRYPDALQKADALQDFTSLLTIQQQQNPEELRKVREFTETVYNLKRELIDYNQEKGVYEGIKPQSATYISELMDMTHVPLRRPVLDTRLRVFEIMNEKMQWPLTNTAVQDFKGESDLGNEVPTSKLEVENFKKFIDILHESTDYEAHKVAASKDVFWQRDRRLYNQIGRPWKPVVRDGMQFTASTDTEFFRDEIPDLENPSIEGLQPGGRQRGEYKPNSVSIGQVGLSMKRANSTIYKRHHIHGKEPQINPEYAPLKADILFPIKYTPSLGSIRTGSTLLDSSYAQMPKKSMKEILQKAGEITELPQADSILAIGITGNTLGNIKLTDYINYTNLDGLGPATIMRTLSQLGMQNLEVNVEMAELLFNKIQNNLNAIKVYIKNIREELGRSNSSELKPKTDILIDEVKTWLIDGSLKSDSFLTEIIEKFDKQNPNLNTSDYALIAYIYAKEPDLFMAVAGGQAEAIAVERVNAERKLYRKLVKEELAAKVLTTDIGQAPTPNPCEHVKILYDIRRLDNDHDYYTQLYKFLNRYQGLRDGNFINCSVCARELICIHDLIKLRMYMHPNQIDVLRKELLLNFSGPISGDQYTCRNCGQSLGEIEFDNNIQFDDEGRPMMGRAAIVDIDAVKEEERDMALRYPAEYDTSKDFGSDTRNKIYVAIKEVIYRIGVYPTDDDYKEMIRMIENAINSVESRETYIVKIKEFIAQGKKVPDYDTYLQRILVFNICAQVIIHVQSRIPDYLVRVTYPGCKKAGFTGYPLGNEEDMTCVEYVTCAVGSIMKNEAPWNQTGLQKETENKRLEILKLKTVAVLKQLMQSIDVQQLLTNKRKYLRNIFGSDDTGDVARDEISEFFLPVQRIITSKDAQESGTIVIPEVNTHMTTTARSAIWIQKANLLAKEEGNQKGDIIVGSPFARGSTAFSEVQVPQGFWMKTEHRLPELPPRELKMGALASRMNVRFVPRPLQNPLPSAPENVYFVLFQNLCYQGPRKGYPHELMYDHTCMHCGFLMTPFQETKEDIDMSQKLGKVLAQLSEMEKKRVDHIRTLFEQQGVNINQDTFTDLLDQMHRNYSVKPLKPSQHKGVFDALREFALLDPAPVPGWPAVMENLISSFSSLPPNFTLADITELLSELSRLGKDAYDSISSRIIDKKLLGALQDIISFEPSQIQEKPTEIAEILNSYFILPFQRLLNNVDPAILRKLSPDLYNLIKSSQSHMEDINLIIDENNFVLRQFIGDFGVNRNELAKAKLRLFIAQISQIPAILRKVMIMNLPGAERTFKYLIQALVFGPISQLLNPNDLPSTRYSQTANAAIKDAGSARLLNQLVTVTLTRYNAEKLVYSADMIQQLLEDRAERERMKVLEDFDRLSNDERALEMEMKRQGLGKWAVGGTKAIREYDSDRYEIEKIERKQAGNLDFNISHLDPNYLEAPGGRNKRNDVGQGYDTAYVDDDDY